MVKLFSVSGRSLNDYGALLEWYWQEKMEVLWEKPDPYSEKSDPVPCCPLQIPNGLSWDPTGVFMVRGEQQTVKKPLDPFVLGILSLAATHLCQHFYTFDTFLVAGTCNVLKYGLQGCSSVGWRYSHVVLNRKTACQQTPSAVSADMLLLMNGLDVLRHCCVGGAGLYLPTCEVTLSRQGQCGVSVMDWMIEDLILERSKWFFFSPKHPDQLQDTAPLPSTASYSVGTGGSFPISKAAGGWSWLYTFMACNMKTSPLLWDMYSPYWCGSRVTLRINKWCIMPCQLKKKKDITFPC